MTEASVAESTIMGHAGARVFAQHYAAQALPTLTAVEAMVLDLSSGQVIALPMRVVGGRGGARNRRSYRETYRGLSPRGPR